MTEFGPPSPRDPRLWYALLREAIAGLQRNDNRPAWLYVRFVEQHRGRGVADEARDSVKRYAAHPAFNVRPAAPTYNAPKRPASPFRNLTGGQGITASSRRN